MADFFAVVDFSDEINDDIYQTGYHSAVFQFTTIGYTFFFNFPPFGSAQVIKCGAQGKVTQQSTLAYTEYKRNQIPIILSISGIGFALFLYYSIPLIHSIS